MSDYFYSFGILVWVHDPDLTCIVKERLANLVDEENQ